MTVAADGGRPRHGKGWWLAVAAAGLLVVAGVGLVVLGDALTADDGAGRAEPTGPIRAALDAATPATDPFPSLTQTTVRIGDRRLRVVIADELAEKVEGLRRRRDLGAYDGMLFVFDTPSRSGFTMSTVPVPLDIGFYDRRGRVVDRLRMRPCAGPESRCPGYVASGAFSYALETLAGDLPRGPLAVARRTDRQTGRVPVTPAP